MKSSCLDEKLLTSLNMNSKNVLVGSILSDAAIGREYWRMWHLQEPCPIQTKLSSGWCAGGSCTTPTPALSVNLPCSLENAKVLMIAGGGIAGLVVKKYNKKKIIGIKIKKSIMYVLLHMQGFFFFFFFFFFFYYAGLIFTRKIKSIHSC